MEPPKALVVAVGGVAGATVRWFLFAAGRAPDPSPWTILAVNVVGSFVLGLVAFRSAAGHRETLRLGVGVGFCGGLTTFSSFAVTAADLVETGRVVTATTFVVASLGLAVAALLAGSTARRRLDPAPDPAPDPVSDL